MKVAATVNSVTEAELVVDRLREAGITAVDKGGVLSARFAVAGPREVYVADEDLERAREVLDEPAISEEDLIRAEEEDAAERERGE